MNFADMLTKHLLVGDTVIRESEPHIEYDLDAAEGVRIWSMNATTDDLLEHAFPCAQIIATDWVISPRFVAMLAKIEAEKRNKMVVCVDNFAREHIADKLIAKDLNAAEAEAMADELNGKDQSKYASDFYVVKRDDYVLSRGMEDLV